mgnify:CR=1 FL=1
MIYTRVDALLSLRPKAEFSWAGTEIYSELNYLSSDTPPTEEELDTEVKRLQAEYDSKLYQRQRASEYPSVVDQLDKMFHSGFQAWKDEIQKVKEKYPKP